MNKRKEALREMIGGAIGFLVISCIYGGYLYIYKDVSIREIVRELFIVTIVAVGITFIGLNIVYFLVLVWIKIKKNK
jgi:hypothetical protein